MIKAKAHTRYKSSSGIPCVGVTTVLGVMNKPALVAWANKLGLEGYEVGKWVDALAKIGTLIHYLIECDIKGEVADLSDYSENDINTAKEAFKKWVAWKEKNQFELIASELQIVDDELLVAGTCDIYAKVNGIPTVLDIKTSKACYSEQRTQVVAYKELLLRQGKEVTDSRIIRIGRSENEGFDDILIGGSAVHWKRFLACLELYRQNKNIDNAGA